MAHNAAHRRDLKHNEKLDIENDGTAVSADVVVVVDSSYLAALQIANINGLALKRQTIIIISTAQRHRLFCLFLLQHIHKYVKWMRFFVCVSLFSCMIRAPHFT